MADITDASLLNDYPIEVIFNNKKRKSWQGGDFSLFYSNLNTVNTACTFINPHQTGLIDEKLDYFASCTS